MDIRGMIAVFILLSIAGGMIRAKEGQGCEARVVIELFNPIYRITCEVFKK